jgi:hypothetical protein
MGFVLPEIAAQRLLQYGIDRLREDKEAFDDIFCYMNHPLMVEGYGANYVDKIWKWFNENNIPVVQAWGLTPDRIPCISIGIQGEAEDESKAAIGDLVFMEEGGEVGGQVNNVTIIIGLHANKSTDSVLWLNYIAKYILFKHKPLARDLGFILQSPYSTAWEKKMSTHPENIYTLNIMLRATVLNSWSATKYQEAESAELINLDVERQFGFDDEDITDYIP